MKWENSSDDVKRTLVSKWLGGNTDILMYVDGFYKLFK